MEKEKCTCEKCSNYDTKKEQLKEKYNKLINDDDGKFCVVIVDEKNNECLVFGQGMNRTKIIEGLILTNSELIDHQIKETFNK